MPKIELFDIQIDNISFEEIKTYFDGFIKNNKPHLIVSLNPLTLLKANKDSEYKNIIKNSNLVLADGAGIIWASKFLKKPLKERITGIEILEYACKLSESHKYKLYFLGSKPDVIKKAAKKLKERYPLSYITGFHHGYFSEDEEKELINSISSLGPDILFVGMGQPAQEKWIWNNLRLLNVPVCIGIGGSFDVISGQLKRAPKWMQKSGLEWLFRTLQEPKRIKEIAKLPVFIFLVLKEKLKTIGKC